MTPMSHTLPVLPTLGVGSYAAPGWFVATWRLARKGELGPHDVDELFGDAIQADHSLHAFPSGEGCRDLFSRVRWLRMNQRRSHETNSGSR